MFYMNKKNFMLEIFLITLVLSFLCFNGISNASSMGNVYLSSNKEVVETQEELEITLNIENVKTVALTAYLTYDASKLEYISGPENINIKQNQIIFVWYDETGGNNPKEGELAKFKFKAKENGLTTIQVSGDFYNKEAQEMSIDFKGIQIQIGKEETKLEKEVKEEKGTNLEGSNATLQTLRLDKEGLIPNFEKEINEYYLTIPNEISSIEVLAVSENPNAIVEITGNTNLKEGLNVITIQITSEDKTKQNTYTIYVTKTKNIELANTNLETLAIENMLLNPPFNTNTTHYHIEIPYETANLNILAIPENENATVKVEGKENLQIGNNLIKVTITAQDGFTKKTIEIEAYRRNKEEENKNKEEQIQNQQKLEEIYEAEKVNTKTTEQSQEVKNKDTSYMLITIGVITIIFIIGIVFLIKKTRKKEKNK